MAPMAGGQPEAALGRRLEALVLTPVLLIVTLGLGFVIWSVVEWRRGRTPSYRVLGLRVVRRTDGEPIGLARSFARSGLCCTVLVIPTIVIGAVVGVCFALGASPPDGLLTRPRAAPWDQLTATKVLDERVETEGDTSAEPMIDDLVGPANTSDLRGPSQNGHVARRDT
jgi:hypothetical protein